MRKVPRVTKPCLSCGKDIITTQKASNRKKFCSRECMGRYSYSRNGLRERLIEWTKSNGGPPNKVGLKRSCLVCHKEFHLYPKDVETHWYCSRQCVLSHIKDSYQKSRGSYVKGYSSLHKTRKAHRIIAMKIWGIELPSDKVLHHINMDRSDNRPENLQIMTHQEHATLHMKENSRLLRELQEKCRKKL